MDSTTTFFGNIKKNMLYAATWFNKAIDINHSGLFEALGKQNWSKIASAIQYPEVSQYAHDHENAILFTAIEQKQYDLAQQLLTLDNVKNDASLNSYYPMLGAIAKKKPDAVRYMLEHIPSIAQHVADDMNTVLINAIFNKQWKLVSDLLILEQVQNNFDRDNFQFICEEMSSERQEIRGMMSHLLLSMSVVKDFFNKNLDAEKFRDLTDISEGYATLVLGEEFLAERKAKSYIPSYPQATMSSRSRKKPQEELEDNASKIEEILSDDEDLSAAHSNKRRRI